MTIVPAGRFEQHGDAPFADHAPPTPIQCGGPLPWNEPKAGNSNSMSPRRIPNLGTAGCGESCLGKTVWGIALVLELLAAGDTSRKRNRCPPHTPPAPTKARVEHLPPIAAVPWRTSPTRHPVRYS